MLSLYKYRGHDSHGDTIRNNMDHLNRDLGESAPTRAAAPRDAARGSAGASLPGAQSSSSSAADAIVSSFAIHAPTLGEVFPVAGRPFWGVWVLGDPPGTPIAKRGCHPISRAAGRWWAVERHPLAPRSSLTALSRCAQVSKAVSDARVIAG